MKQKGNTVIIILILIVLAVVGYFGYKTYQQKIVPLPSPTGKVSLIPADQKTPAASSCNSIQGNIVSVKLNIDVPNPRCVVISATQMLTLVNGSGQTISLNYGSYNSQIPAGSSYTFPLAAGSFLAPGVHRIKTSLYRGSGPEVWLQTPTVYTCPSNGYVDCQPVLDAAREAACSSKAFAWYKANCPNFKGGAY